MTNSNRKWIDDTETIRKWINGEPVSTDLLICELDEWSNRLGADAADHELIIQYDGYVQW